MIKSRVACAVALGASFAVIAAPDPASADRTLEELSEWALTLPCCDMDSLPGVVWWGADSTLMLEEIAAYCAPILWFSPDEPLLDDGSGRDIVVPEPFPFEEPGGPVTHFRVRRVLTVGDPEGRSRGSARTSPNGPSTCRAPWESTSTSSSTTAARRA